MFICVNHNYKGAKTFQKFFQPVKIVALNLQEEIFFQLPSLFLRLNNTVAVAQLVRASDCGSEGRRFEPG